MNLRCCLFVCSSAVVCFFTYVYSFPRLPISLFLSSHSYFSYTFPITFFVIYLIRLNIAMQMYSNICFLKFSTTVDNANNAVLEIGNGPESEFIGEWNFFDEPNSLSC